ncbi:hypothetical protein [Paraglaciecola sp. T6c]|uniref:hypothetical protein n=1 Tax=Pseudoalteromonas atlantica (strain T6c / ATCC BAA-1087) TaxID=3042615 RepID=UPI0002EB7ACD|nr:hypothetical protein [Paraglaciecola sp. T6c]
MMNKNDEVKDKKDLVLEDSEAEAASPIAESIAGEEDPGAALEEFIKMDKIDEGQETKQD